MILFLAYDGVLRTPADRAGELNGQLIANFTLLLRRFGRSRVVLSTSWRLARPYPELLAWFHRDLHPRFAGRLPEIKAPPAAPRQAEIALWLKRNGGADQPWVAIDTDAARFESPCPALFLCEPSRGLDAGALTALEQRIVAIAAARIARRAAGGAGSGA
ncbi:MAG: HAD domain-containing protein [Gammaproteobacteria bacterium]